MFQVMLCNIETLKKPRGCECFMICFEILPCIKRGQKIYVCTCSVKKIARKIDEKDITQDEFILFRTLHKERT